MKELGRFPFLVLGFMLAYVLGIIFTEVRIEHLRSPINEHAIQEGIKAGVAEYKKEYLRGEHLTTLKRKERDRLLLQYVKNLEKVLSSE